MFVLGVLLVNATYKVMMFGAMPTSDKKGKTPLSDLPTIVKHSMPAPTTYDFCFFVILLGLNCVFVHHFSFGYIQYIVRIRSYRIISPENC